MNQSQIIKILDRLCNEPSESIESDTIEFKYYSSEAALHNAKDLADEISALANLKGGIILIGVRDGSNVPYRKWAEQLSGFTHVDLHTTRERLRGKLKPFIDINLVEISYDGKNYLLIRVPRCKDSLVTTTSGRVCIRDGKSSRPMTPDEIEQAVKNLQDYDWSSESLDLIPADALNTDAVQEALLDFTNRRNLPELDSANFLEAIGATHNGLLTKCGLLFLGKIDVIREQLGKYEYRFSRKSRGGILLVNDVWEDCLWETIKRGKTHFNHCNDMLKVVFEDKEYLFQLLDSVAFHEAYLNALVHRDYTIDGMVSVNFIGDRLEISSPGIFYGGVTAENIAKHDPRHRNKSLAKMLMEFHLVDRAGMGVVRMNINSLRYGRKFPSFIERDGSVEVTMQGEYLRIGIFILTKDEGTNYGVPELLILNAVYEIGVVSVQTLCKQLAKVVDDPWSAIEHAIEILPSVELCGTRAGIFVRVNPEWNRVLGVTKTFRITSASPKHVSLYRYLIRHGSASNADIKTNLEIKRTSQTSTFLKTASYVRRSGRGPSSLWSLSRKDKPANQRGDRNKIRVRETK
jgi:ATP-dependent DNA helicase RecG